MIRVKKFKKVPLLIVIFLFTLNLVACNTKNEKSKAEDETYQLKFYWVTSDTENDPYAIAAHAFKDSVEAKTNGKVKINLYPNAQLGGERDAIEGMSLGTIDMGVITNAPVSGLAPEFQALDLPFIFDSSEQAHEILDSEFGKNLLSKLEEKGIKGLGYAEGGFRMMINNTRPINTPSDVEGVKFRVMENPIYIGMFKALGSNPTPMSWEKTFTAVQQKTIDGLESPISVISQNKYYEVTKYLSLTNHTYSPLIFMASMKSWGKLPEDIQTRIQESVDEAVEFERNKNGENVSILLEDLKSKGMVINEVEDFSLFKEKVEPLYNQFEDEIGKSILEELLEKTK